MGCMMDKSQRINKNYVKKQEKTERGGGMEKEKVKERERERERGGIYLSRHLQVYILCIKAQKSCKTISKERPILN